MRSTYHLVLAAELVRKPSRAAHLIAAAALLIVSTLGTALVSTPARASVESEAFIQQTVDGGYEILNSTTLSVEDRRIQFQEFMLSLTDMRRISSFTLGPYVNRAPEADVEDFVEAFTDYAVTVYEDRLSRYAGLTMMVAGSNDGAADDSVVNVIVYTPNDEINPNQQSINVAFRVREDANGNLIVIDMQVEGVWLAVSQRADFTSYLQQNNGSVPALSNSLRRQAERIRGADGT